jgi:hypothetical protein
VRERPQRLTAYSAFASLALGAVGVAFERAGPSVMSAGPEELTDWARERHRELTAQSGVYLVSTVPLLSVFAGLSSCLRQSRHTPRRVDPSLAVLGGGSAWVLGNAAAQAVQLSMARRAAAGADPESVAALGDRMRRILVYGNASLSVALTATSVAASRDDALPRWLGRLSGVAAAAHAAPVVSRRLENLPYPFFVAWLVGVAATLARRPKTLD